jgi:hypothetical protein
MVKAITYILENDATVQGLVGTKSQDAVDAYHKIYPVVAPSTETAPYCAVRLIGRTTVAKGCDDVYQINVASYALSYDAATTLNEAVRSAIEATAAATINGVAFGYANAVNEADDYVKEHNLYAKITTFEAQGT